ncbi:MAG: hypothetical protein WDO14_13625 [Bacteroidota bacterium]
MINETAAFELGWTPETAIEKILVTSGQTEYHVVGVVKDFNYISPRQKVGPLVMMLRYNRGSILVKLSTPDIQAFLTDMKARWDHYNSDSVISFFIHFS